MYLKYAVKQAAHQHFCIPPHCGIQSLVVVGLPSSGIPGILAALLPSCDTATTYFTGDTSSSDPAVPVLNYWSAEAAPVTA